MAYKTVLHIDDDQDDLDFFSTTVEEIKPDVLCISLNSAEDALKKIRALEFLPEIIFLDLNMPRMNGFQFLEAIKKIPGLKIPVVVLSTSSQEETIDTVKELGASDYITKPSNIDEFIRLLTPFLL